MHWSERARREAGSRFVESFFHGLSRVARMHPLADPRRHGVTIERDVPYLDSDHRAHRVDVYRPTGQRPHATVLYVHGGGFRILSKDTHWAMALAFARRGYLVVNVGYRLTPTHPFPAAVEDVCQAFGWLVDHADALGADLDRLILAGESAGANLATTLALCTLYPRDEPYARAVFDRGVTPKAVVPACGILQVSDVARFARRRALPDYVLERLEVVEHGYIGRDPTVHGPTLDLADPLSWLEREGAPTRPLPAFFLPVGTKDPLLPDSRRMVDAVRARGGHAEAIYYPGQIHAFHAFVFREVARQCWRDTYAFLDARCPA